MHVCIYIFRRMQYRNFVSYAITKKCHPISRLSCALNNLEHFYRNPTKFIYIYFEIYLSYFVENNVAGRYFLIIPTFIIKTIFWGRWLMIWLIGAWRNNWIHLYNKLWTKILFENRMQQIEGFHLYSIKWAF